ncbi:hypothetical protein [Vibrio brasiliensis]|uniref:hypothetical protein n=1 Tax=Vibrio brasiliensis TaxID=170652 RepID=UPI001EFDDA72|nr:hypothetical protein [Vibrio brasiliensis]MCG9725489.1 hypothetical protein [Vibrio brasiliensis]
MRSTIFILSMFLLWGCGEEAGTESSEEKIEASTLIDSNGLGVISLNNTYPLIINAEKGMKVNSLVSLPLPNQVNLNDISISGTIIRNNTPYEISELILKENGEFFLVGIEGGLPKYTQGNIDISWGGYEVVSFTVLANSTFEYQSSTPPANPVGSRLANTAERNTAELVQIYDRYMTNAPSTLSEITEQLRSRCPYNPKCYNYEEPVEQYASDTYFAKSVSSMNTRLWINDNVWGLGSQPALNFNSSESESKSLNIWMSPVLMANVQDSIDATAIDAWQGLVHEYYHNQGFSHESGWPSSKGIDDVFGRKVVYEYLPSLGNKLINPDVFINDIVKVDMREYEIGLSSKSEKLVNLRLLSTEPIKAVVSENSSDKIRLKFEETPKTEVYLSFYTADSLQMASSVLSFSLRISTQSDLNDFNSNINLWLQEYDEIHVSTQNGSWVDNYILPTENVDEGKVVTFESYATWDSLIYYDYPGISSDTLSTGGSYYYEFNNGAWKKL